MTPKVSMALGSFDGLHIGHMAVISCALNNSKYGLSPSALIFDEHPIKVLNGTSPGIILQPQLRDEILKNVNIKPEFVSFSSIMEMSPEDFFYDILIDKMQVGALSCGTNFKFGKKALGNVDLLKTLCDKEHIILSISEDVLFENQIVSSTRIRREIENGNIKLANIMLGREFKYKLEVKNGSKRGRLIGAPTINQYFDCDFVKPKQGTYISYTIVQNKKYPSVTNIGFRPTFENEDFRSETHIIGYEGDLYGEFIEVRLLDYLRNETKFSSNQELSNQIIKDIRASKEYFNDFCI